jgi:hypothetical protein
MTDVSGLTAMVPVVVGGAVVLKVTDMATRKRERTPRKGRVRMDSFTDQQKTLLRVLVADGGFVARSSGHQRTLFSLADRGYARYVGGMPPGFHPTAKGKSAVREFTERRTVKARTTTRRMTSRRR